MESVKIVSISLPIHLVQKIDHCRKDISRSRFVQRLLETGFDKEKSNVTNPYKSKEIHTEFFDEATKIQTIALRKGTEIHNNKKQIKNKTNR